MMKHDVNKTGVVLNLNNKHGWFEFTSWRPLRLVEADYIESHKRRPSGHANHMVSMMRYAGFNSINADDGMPPRIRHAVEHPGNW